MSAINLKARAKRLRAAVAAMFNTPVSVAQSLELVAQEENYPNWDAASANFGNVPTASPATRLGLSATASDFLRNYTQHGMFIVATACSGKRMHVLSTLLDRLRIGKTVVVLDYGRNYYHVAETVGGTYYDLQPNGEHEVRRFGDAPLIVCDFDRVTAEGQAGGAVKLPDLPCALRSDQGFILVDEIWAVSALWPETTALVQSVAKAGGSYCVVGQHDEDLLDFAICQVPVMMTIRLEAGPPWR